jgi:protocatechuate 4,5-dioxygenase beta chain/2,3-dihydroxyphenylpropionate 1,2-dioxygenase
MGQIVAAGATVHAPQFFTRPPTEVPEQLDAGLAAMNELGRQMLDETQPDVLIVIGSDHLETFFLSAVPTFAVISGERIKAAFAGRNYDLPCHPMAEGLLNHLVESGFDMVYSQDAELGHAFAAPFEWVLGKRAIPVVPIFVNTYLPPLPNARRCEALGKAIAAYIETRPERVAIVASGGMSHYPGTWKYPEPAFDFDHWAIAHLERGNTDAILNMTNSQLDETGNTELLSWAVMFGAIGAKRGELLTYQPTWHHGHAVLRFLPEPAPKDETEVIPPFFFTGQTNEFYGHPAASSYNLNKLLYDLRHDAELRRHFIANAKGVAEERHLAPREIAVIDTLLDENIDLLRNRKTHPIVEEGAHALGLLMSLVVVQAEMRRIRREAQA